MCLPLVAGYSVDAVYVSFGYFVMLSYFIPISAFVNFEISKLSNAGFMITDNEMRSKKGLPMKVKSTHLADEMSRVSLYSLTSRQVSAFRRTDRRVGVFGSTPCRESSGLMVVL